MQVIHGFLANYDIALLLNYAETGNAWTKGRQDTGYNILFLKDQYGAQYLIDRAKALLGPIFEDFWDCYLIRYNVGEFIPSHKDDVALFGKRHRRLNAMVKLADEGGDFIINGSKVEFPLGAAIDFFPDDEEHEVTKVEKGQRLVFTVGIWQ